MAEYQKEIATGKLDLAQDLLQELLSREPAGERKDTLQQIIDLVSKAKEHILSV